MPHSPSDTHRFQFIQLSQDLLYAVKTGNHADHFVQQLKVANIGLLQQALGDDNHKKAFWLNIYNAFVQLSLSQNPQQYQHRNRFFQHRFINIGTACMSLDGIEHGILRRSQLKWGFGYLPNPFASALEKQMRVTMLDCRIHFALNCGAQSCPPIAFYTPEKIETQLEMATANYLQQEAIYISAQNKCLLPAIINWFRGDFGGKIGMLRLLRQYHIIPATTDAPPSISFKEYDWSLLLKVFTAG
jgi:Protein of unknown function, DUF547